MPQPGTHAGATPLALLHLLLHSVKGRLVPLRLSIQNIFITSPDEDCLPHLPREAVPGSCSYPSCVYWFLPPVFTVLMLFHKWRVDALSVITKMLPASSKEVSWRLANIYALAVIRAELTFQLIIYTTPSQSPPSPYHLCRVSNLDYHTQFP